MHLSELNRPATKRLDVVVSSLQKRLGNLYRVGGKKRYYKINNEATGAIYIIGNSYSAVGFSWNDKVSGVNNIYLWKNFNIEASPDFVLNIPDDVELTNEIYSSIVEWLRQPHTGNISVEGNVMEADAPKINNNISQQDKEEFKNLIALGQAMGVNAQAQKGEVVLMARRADGTYFEIPGFSEYTAKLEKLAKKYYKERSSLKKEESMEEQYANLKDYVQLIAGRKTVNTNALVVCGAPGLGKTYNVKNTIHELGLKSGKDYAFITGAATAASLYKLFVQNLDTLLVFDDCDDVWKDNTAVNLLKGALNTGKVRQVSYETARSFNTTNMEPEERKQYTYAMSRILNGTHTSEDVKLFLPYVNVKQTPKSSSFSSIISGDNKKEEALQEYTAVKKYVLTHLPSMIDYTGRIIFITNIPVENLDSAVKDRAYIINLNFSSEDVLDFIRSIQKSMHSNLSETDKSEIIDYIEELYINGQLAKPISIRLIQNCFDLRNSPNWKKLIAQNVKKAEFFTKNYA